MRTVAGLEAWLIGAKEEFGDPSVPVCQLFFRWHSNLEGYSADELACSVINDELALVMCHGIEPELLPVRMGEPDMTADECTCFGLQRITPRLWTLTPSFNAPGYLHAFIVLYDVPNPAPWERRLVLPGDPGFPL